VKVELQVAVPAVVPAARVQLVNVPVTPVTPKVTEPVGVVAPVADVSVTVTLQVDPWLITTGLVQVTMTLVGWRPTFTANAVLVLAP
jgi:hypothetical protein